MLIHLIGIGGTGMGNLAVLLGRSGHRVRGSDAAIYAPMDSILERARVDVVRGYRPGNLDPTPDLVVIGNVCRPDHPEARAAVERGLAVASLPGALRGLVLRGRRPLVVAGTHGKTTTSALLVHLLDTLGASPGHLVGGRLAGRESGASPGSGPWFVVEGDEYDSAFFEKHAKFLSYEADGLIVTSVEHDHVDIYPSFRSYRTAFRRLASGLPRTGCLVACADQDACLELASLTRARTLTYSAAPGADADYRATLIRPGQGSTRFDLEGPSGSLGTFELPLSGAHNVANATAALALAIEHASCRPDDLGRALACFPGVARRQERAGEAGGVTVLDDFGHHPTAVRATLEGLASRLTSGARLVAVLRPASATACRSTHQSEWVEALSCAHASVLAPLARTSIPDGEKLDLERLGRELRGRGREAVLAPTLDAVAGAVAGQARPGDTVVFFSNTDPGTLIEDTLAALRGSPDPGPR